MPRRLRSNRGLSAQQAHQALSVLLHDGKVRASEVWKAVKRREHLVEDLKGRLAALEAGIFPAVQAQTGKLARKRKRARRKPISGAQRAAWKAQGRYMAAVRRLSKANRAKVKAIRARSGARAAIAAAKKMARS
jgi:hypothetical protein